MKPNETSAPVRLGLNAILPAPAFPETGAILSPQDSLGARTRRPKAKLSRTAVDAALASWGPGTRLRVFFEHPKGLFLNITPKGATAYYLQFAREDGSRSETVIGAEKQLTPALAAKAADRLIAEMTLTRVNPVAAKRHRVAEAKQAKAHTFRAVTKLFQAAAENLAVSPGTLEYRTWRLETHILPRLGDKPVKKLTRADIRACTREVQAAIKAQNPEGDQAGHKTANACKELIGQILNWAVDEEIIQANPAAGMKALFEYKPKKRIGKCDEATLRAFWDALQDEGYKGWGKASGLCIRLVMLTAARSNEVVKAYKPDFDFDNLLWSPGRARNKTRSDDYAVPLTPYTAELFQTAFRMSGSDWAFPGKDGKPMKAKITARHWARCRGRLIKARAPVIPDCTLRDASRRYVRTYLELVAGFSEPVCEAVINHAPEDGMSRIYFVGDLSTEIRKAHEAWQRELLRIIWNEPRPNNVTTITREAAE
jgi:integrase